MVRSGLRVGRVRLWGIMQIYENKAACPRPPQNPASLRFLHHRLH